MAPDESLRMASGKAYFRGHVYNFSDLEIIVVAAGLTTGTMPTGYSPRGWTGTDSTQSIADFFDNSAVESMMSGRDCWKDLPLHALLWVNEPEPIRCDWSNQQKKHSVQLAALLPTNRITRKGSFNMRDHRVNKRKNYINQLRRKSS
jgi:hypothetical protein